MKNILFISYDGLTDPLGQSQVIPYLIGLTRHGFRFTILSCDKRGKFIANQAKIRSILKPYPIRWVSIPYHKSPPVLSTIFDTLRLKRKARQLHRKEPFHLVHTRAGTPALIGLYLQKKYGVKFLNDLRDFFADSRVDSGSWNLKNPLFRKIYRFFKKKESEAIGRSDGIVCLTHAVAKIIQNSPQCKKTTPLQVIPCSVDMQLFDPRNIDRHRKERWANQLKIGGGDMIFSFLGSVKDWHMMFFFKIISDIIPQAKFLFITPDLPEMIMEKATEYAISEEKIIITEARRDEVPVLLSFSDYAVFFIPPSYSVQAASPTKHGEIMAMGIPVISNKGIGDVADIIQQYHSGFVIDNFKGETFFSLATIIHNGQRFDREAIRQGAREYYDLENAISLYRSMYEKIFEKGLPCRTPEYA